MRRAALVVAVACLPRCTPIGCAATCPPSSVAVDDSARDAVCACVGDRTACVAPGEERCVSARRANETKQRAVLRHSEMIRQDWPVVVKANMTSLLPFPGKIQGFRPTCKGCRCVEPCKRIVFVVGCGHSGTTYLTRLLASHPRYRMVMAESGWFTTYGGTRVSFESWRRESFACGRQGGSVLVEKTPKHVLALGKIFRCFPDAKVVLIQRDGRDVVLSLAKRFRYSLERNFGLCMAASRWVTDNRAAEPFLADPRLTTVRYEHLVAHPHATVDTLFTFLEGTAAPHEVHNQFGKHGNLTWGRLHPVRIGPPDTPGDGLQAAIENKILRNYQVNQPLFNGSGRWASEFSTTQLKALYTCAGFEALLRKLEYATKFESDGASTQPTYFPPA